MPISEYLDLVLFVAMGIDLFLKNRRYKKIKKKMPKWQRYQYNATQMRNIIYLIIIVLSIIYVLFRIYTIMFNVPFVFPKIMILIPCIDYYVLWDYFLAGIYFNRHAIYYKSEFYEFRRATHIYRYLVKNHYEYDMTYRDLEGGLRDVLIKIPNEKAAYPLLMCIPFEEEEQN